MPGFVTIAQSAEKGIGNEILQEDATEFITVDFDNTFDIVLGCNLTTGFDILVSYFPGLVKLVDFDTEQLFNKEGKIVVGAPINCRYTFELLVPANAKIWFTNARPSSYETSGVLAYEVKIKDQ